MGNRRLVSQQLKQSLRRFIRPLNSAAPTSISPVSPINFETKPKDSDVVNKRLSGPVADVINVADVKQLFSSVSTSQLLRSAINLQVSGIEPMVDLGLKVMNSSLMKTALFREASLGVIKHTIFDHFCAGQTPTEAALTAERLWDSGLKGMLVYALEHATDNASCDENLDGFLQTVESTKSLPSNSVSFTVAKITALCPPKLLLRVSDLLRWEYKDPSFKLPWKLHTLPIFSESSPLYHTQKKPDPLTPEEESDLYLAHQRLMELCEKCLEANVPLSIDAEDTCVQPAIDYFTYSAALAYNKYDNPIVYGTIQTYLKDAEERLVLAANAAEAMGLSMGFKLVRGAYMNSERKRALSLGAESPIHSSIGRTHDCFNDSAAFMLDKVANGSGAVVLATHNIESGNMAVAKARELGIGRDNPKLQFAQLYGMADALSFGLRNAGFQVSKYMPFGPVELVMPYLLRRAEENRGLLSTSTLDKQLLRKELKRRLKEAIV